MPYNQSAIFIDAGFILSVGSAEVTGTSLRSATQVQVEDLIKGIVATTHEDSGFTPLRVYWYDASRDGVFTSEHKKIALLDDVKVRLGRVGYNGQQKGVDLRLGLDLVEVARNRAARIAYLLTGDDDLAEAVEAAQDLGMKVVLVGIEDDASRLGMKSVAEHLALQVDRIITLPPELITACFVPYQRVAPGTGEPTVPAPPAATAPRAEVTIPTPAQLANRAGAVGVSPVTATPLHTSSSESPATGPTLLEQAEEVAIGVARSWYGTTTQSELTEVLRDRPILPPELDATLLRDCASRIGESDTYRQSVRRHLRQSFWDELDRLQ